MKFVAATAIATLLGLSLNVHAAEDVSGFYFKGSIGQASTKLDTSNTVHATYITADQPNKTGSELALGYRFGQYFGVELAQARFGSPSYNLTRGSSGEQSVLTVKNVANVVALRGFYPVNDAITITGRAGIAMVKTNVSRVGEPSYDGSENQTHATYGVGMLYKLTPNLSAAADLNLYPNITKTSDNATDTSARMVSVGLQYRF
ncbi:porin family protein [Limnohabitans sp.]|uniref:porin family protein n=1 Tax=Limnohabitans sp. TaxID=1907725 RepID=UPI0028A199B1|nr:porin family protein [Limnohabitans sp.]